MVAFLSNVKPLGSVQVQSLFKKSQMIPHSTASVSFKLTKLIDVSQLAAPQKPFYEAPVL